MFDVTDNAEAQLRIFVEDLSRGHVVTQIGGDKSRVTADLAEQRSHLFASSQSGIGGKDAMTLGCKLVERVWHGRFFRKLATAILPAGTRIVHYSSSNLVQSTPSGNSSLSGNLPLLRFGTGEPACLRGSLRS